MTAAQSPDWLMSRPSGWGVVPFRHLFRRTKRVGFENEVLLSVYRDHGVVEKASRSDNFNNPSEDLSAYQLVRVGDLAINKMKAWQGSVAISPLRGIVSPAYFVYTPTHSAHDGFLHYLFRSAEYTNLYQLYSKGIRVNQWDLDPAVHGSMPVLLPPFDGQRRIAEFLDHETAQIDALIAKQQQLISTLAERVEARTVFAFTRAKSTTGPLESSLHSVLGPIPSGWGVVRMKYIILSRRSGTSVNATGEPAGAGEVGVLKTSAVSTGRLDLSQNKLVVDPEEIARLQVGVRAGTILVNRANSPQLVGAAALVRENYPGLYLSDKLWELETTAHPGFLNAWMRTRAYRSQVGFCTVGASSSMQNLAFEDFKEFYIPLPPAADQARVCSEIEELERTADAVTSAAQAQIALSRERRQALISAAVTGKIDVGSRS